MRDYLNLQYGDKFNATRTSLTANTCGYRLTPKAGTEGVGYIDFQYSLGGDVYVNGVRRFTTMNMVVTEEFLAMAPVFTAVGRFGGTYTMQRNFSVSQGAT